MVKSDKMAVGGREKKVEEPGGDGDDDDIYCGVGPFRPACMQGCARMGWMTVALCFAGLSTSTLSIYINSQITTLERQFGFSSSVSGVLLSCNDLGYLLTTLLASFLARRVHIPRALSLSTFLFGMSGLLCTIPFFATKGDLPPTPHLTQGPDSSNLSSLTLDSNPFLTQNGGGGKANFDAILCELSNLTSATAGNASSGDDVCQGEGRIRWSAISEGGKNLAVVFLGLGMIFQGFGKSPRHPFIGTYVDDNVPKTKTTFYLGIISSCSIFGPVLAFTLGGLFSKIYLTLEETNMSPTDPRWVGAWWLGFLLFGFLGIITAIPTVFFPRRLKPQPHLRMLEQKRKELAKGRLLIYDFKEFFRTILRLVRTPVYICTVLGSCISLFGIGGMMAFLPKYLETQFQIPAWKANMLLGVLNVLAAAGGTLAGGILASRFKLTPIACLRLMVATTVLSTCSASAGFFIGCDQPIISMGASMTFQNKYPVNDNMTQPLTCLAACHCDDTRFFPVCGVDGVTYFSPCHAGCSETKGIGYGSCSCVNINSTATATETESSPSEDSPTSIPASGPEVLPGFCDTECRSLYTYASLNFFGALFSTFVIMPSFIVSVRSVSESDKPLAIGLSAFLATLLGWFLGPIVYGRVVDMCCILWSSGCDGSGSCTLYDIKQFRNGYHSLFVATRAGTCLMYAIALIVASLVKAKLTPRSEIEVIKPATEAEGQTLVERNGKSGNDVAGEEDKMLGGPRIYKGNDFAV